MTPEGKQQALAALEVKIGHIEKVLLAVDEIGNVVGERKLTLHGRRMDGKCEDVGAYEFLVAFSKFRHYSYSNLEKACDEYNSLL